MKKWAAIFMLLCISYQYVIKLGIVAWYQLNKDYVAAVLCENKSKPGLKCNGKCYLNKQLKKTEDTGQSSKQTPAKNYKAEIPEFIPTEIAIINYPFVEDIIVFHDGYKQSNGFDPLVSIFHPPSVG